MQIAPEDARPRRRSGLRSNSGDSLTHRTGGKRHELLDTLRARPSILLTALTVFAVCTAIGVVATWLTARSQKQNARSAAQSAAEDAADAVRAQLLTMTRLVSATAAYVSAGLGLNYTTLLSLYPAAAANLLKQANTSVPGVVQALLPQAVIMYMYPPPGTSNLGVDLLTGNTRQDVLAQLQLGGIVTIRGPVQVLSETRLVASQPIFFSGVSATETFSQPVPTTTSCPAGICWQPATGTKFWGIVSATANLGDILFAARGPIALLSSRDFNYRIYQLNSMLPATPGLPANATMFAQSVDVITDPETYYLTTDVGSASPWVIETAPINGWGVPWEAPVYVVVVILSLLLALAFSVLQISRFQHQLLLYSLVPKHLVAELKRRSSYVDFKADDAFELNTPAEVMLALLADCLLGQLPDPATVVQLRATLLNLQDIYRPTDLSEQLKAADLDDEVANALFGLIGRGSNSRADLVGRQAAVSFINMRSTSTNLDGGVEDADLQTVLESILKGQLDNPASSNMQRRASSIWQSGGVMEAAAAVRRPSGLGNSHSLLQSQVDAILSNSGLHEQMQQQVDHPRRPADRQGSLSNGGKTDNRRPSQSQATESSLKSHMRRISHMLTFKSGSGGSDNEDDRKTGQQRTPLGTPSPRQHSQPPPEVSPAVVDELARILEQAYSSWTFDAFALHEASFGRPLSTLGYALIHKSGVMESLKLKPVKVARFLQALEASYMDNPYHCKIHAADVLQTYHVILTRGGFLGGYLDPIRHLGCYMAAAAHDVEHEGVTNDYLITTESMLALRYNDRSPMENHHLAATYSLLKYPANNFVGHLAKESRDALRKVVIDLVLATDMKQHLTITSQFKSMHKKTVEGPAELPKAALTRNMSVKKMMGSVKVQFQQQVAVIGNNAVVPECVTTKEMQPLDETERMLSLQMALKVADLGHLAEEEEVHTKWVSRLEEEFFKQGDKEKERSLPISPLFDRSKPGVTKSQVGFFDFVALPLFRMFTTVFPASLPLLDHLEDNYYYWKDLADGTMVQRDSANQASRTTKHGSVTPKYASFVVPPSSNSRSVATLAAWDNTRVPAGNSSSQPDLVSKVERFNAGDHRHDDDDFQL